MAGTNVVHISSILAHLLLKKKKKKREKREKEKKRKEKKREKEKEQPYSLVYLIESMHFLSIRKPFHILKGKHN